MTLLEGDMFSCDKTNSYHEKDLKLVGGVDIKMDTPCQSLRC